MSAKIAAALHEVMSKVAYVQKTGKNAFHGYKYAGEADLLDKLRPAMIEAGLLLLPSGQSVTPVDEHGNVTVSIAYTLAHKDGDVWPHPLVAFGAGNDRNKNGVGDKGVYKAITGANKYLLFKLFQIETGDDPDQDERQPEPASRKTTERAAPQESVTAPGRQFASTDALLDAARAAATNGTEAFRAFWKERTLGEKATIKPYLTSLETAAKQADITAEGIAA